jgi:hypothetical protein
MRRTASEMITILEQRVARLEKRAGFLDFFTGKISLGEIEGLLKREHKSAKIDVSSPDRISLSFEMNSRVYWFDGHFVKNKQKIKVSGLSSMLLFNKLRGKSPQDKSLNDPSLLVIDFTPNFQKMGVKSANVGSLFVYIDTDHEVILKSDFKDRLKFKPFMKTLNKSMGISSY